MTSQFKVLPNTAKITTLDTITFKALSKDINNRKRPPSPVNRNQRKFSEKRMRLYYI